MFQLNLPPNPTAQCSENISMWTNHKTSTAMTDETEVEMFGHNAQNHDWWNQTQHISVVMLQSTRTQNSTCIAVLWQDLKRAVHELIPANLSELKQHVSWRVGQNSFKAMWATDEVTQKMISSFFRLLNHVVSLVTLLFNYWISRRNLPEVILHHFVLIFSFI